jgi:hypothetical protein
MPGLKLTPSQAQRLWAVDRTRCEQLLASLVKADFLQGNPPMHGHEHDERELRVRGEALRLFEQCPPTRTTGARLV